MRALGRGGGADDAAGTAQTEVGEVGELALEDSWVQPEPDAIPESDPISEPDAGPAPVRERFGWLAPTLAMIALAGWTGFYIWAMRSEMFALPTPAPSNWADWIVQWSVPAGLIGISWLQVRRSSRADAHRFAMSAALLSRESAELEARLKVVNRELSLAREFLAAEARDLEALGRIAAERLSAHAGELQALITTNGAQVEAISSASDTALGNMNRLRDELPVIANAARDVANQIGNAGNTAQDRLDQLVNGFDRLQESGSATDSQVAALSQRIDAMLSGFEAQVASIASLVSNRFDGLKQATENHRDEIAQIEAQALGALRERMDEIDASTAAMAARLNETDAAALAQMREGLTRLEQEMTAKIALIDELERKAVAAARHRIVELNQEAGRFDNLLAERDQRFNELIEQRQAEFDTRETQASELLAQRLASLDDALAQRREAQLADTAQLVAHGEAIASRLDQLNTLMAEVTHHGDTARTSLSAGLGTLGQQLADKRMALADTEARLKELTDSGVRLLEIIQSGARATRDDLPKAIAAADASLAGVEARADKVNHLMLNSSQHGNTLSDYLVQTRSEIDAADTALAGFKSRLAEQASDALERLQSLRGGFASLAEESGTLAHNAQEQLRGALGMLEAAIAQAFATLDAGAREKATALAESIGGEALQALERSLRNESAATIGKLEQAAAHASGVGREAAIQLRDQLVRVNELTGNLEQRVARARELAEEQVNNDFARRMALITDSLNSAAIDITGAISTEVPDSAWAAYLKGDRGIFTRRAVRLLDAGMSRDIATLYSEDETFKANVSRYIHDFEAMLRSMLSTRDGHVLSVTVLGSDMGKLYVGLAQAIQRFRT